MIHPRPDEFGGGGMPVAMYRDAAGAVLHVAGLPASDLAPLNGEARYAKASAIARMMREQPLAWLDEVPKIAVSLGAQIMPEAKAAIFVFDWLNAYAAEERAKNAVFLRKHAGAEVADHYLAQHRTAR